MPQKRALRSFYSSLVLVLLLFAQGSALLALVTPTPPPTATATANATATATAAATGTAVPAGTRAPADIVINEFMVNPIGSDSKNEWLELYNRGSGTENLSGWKVYTGSNHTLTLVKGSWELAANEYLVVAKNATAFLERRPLFDGTLLRSPIVLPSSEVLLGLFATSGGMINPVTYNASDWGACVEGYSFECVDPWAVLDAPANWRTTLVVNGTPGMRNSHYAGDSPVADDPPIITGVTLDPDQPTQNDTVAVTVQATDDDALSSLTLEYRVDLGAVQTETMTDIGGGQYTASIPAQHDAAFVEYAIYAEDDAGQVTAEPRTAPGTRASYWVRSGIEYAIVINEVLPKPDWDFNGDFATDNGDEFIELYNNGTQTAYLAGWQLDDEPDGGDAPYTLPIGAQLAPGAFWVLYGNTTGLGLTDASGTVTLLDHNGVTVDQYNYSGSHANRSFGRLPNGSFLWTEFDAPTPASNNGEFVNVAPTITAVTLDPAKPASTDAVNVTIAAADDWLLTAVELDVTGLPGGARSLTCSATDAGYRATLPAAPNGTRVTLTARAGDWWGLVTEHTPVDYIVQDYTPAVVINELLPAPASTGNATGEEWVELFNPHPFAVDIGGWQLAKPAPTRAEQFRLPVGTIVNATGYLVITEDRSGLSLVNAGDTILLRCANGTLRENWTYENAALGESFGRLPDGGRNRTRFAVPTPGVSNGPLINHEPSLIDAAHTPLHPTSGEAVTVTVTLTDDWSASCAVTLAYRIDGGTTERVAMVHTANTTRWHGGIGVADLIQTYSGSIPGAGNRSRVTYWIEVADESAARNQTDPITYLVSAVAPPVVLNEVLVAPTAVDWNGDGVETSDDEWIEIYNPGPLAADLSGFILDDNPLGASTPYVLPVGTILEPDAYLTLYGSETGLVLRNTDGEVTLISHRGETLDHFEYETSAHDRSWARFSNGVGTWKEFETPTPNATNGEFRPPTAAEASIIISRCYYKSAASEFFKLSNPSSVAVDLGNWWVSDNEGELVFPSPLVVPAGASRIFAKDVAVYNLITGSLPDVALTIGPEFEGYGILSLREEGNLLLDDGGDELLLYDAMDTLIDAVIWGDSAYNGSGWDGDPAMKVGESQLLVRSSSGPGQFADTNGSEDWDSIQRHVIGQSDIPYIEFDVTATVTAYCSPDSSYTALTNALDAAQNTILVEVYQITSWPLAETLVAACQRGVDVRLFIEGGPVGGLLDQTRAIAEAVYDAGGQVRFMINDEHRDIDQRYRYVHAKYCVIDHRIVGLGSENWGPTGYPVNTTYGNVGWGILIESAEVAAYYEDIFEADWNPTLRDSYAFTPTDLTYGAPPSGFQPSDEVPTGSYTPTFETVTATGQMTIIPVVSPDTVLTANGSVIGMIAQAQETVYVEQADINPDWSERDEHYPNLFLEAVYDAARRGCQVRFLLDSEFSYKNNPDYDNFDLMLDINDLARRENLDMECRLADLKSLGLEKVHNKGVIVDNSSVLVASVNWGRWAVVYNREVGVIVDHPTIAGFYADTFTLHWNGGFTEAEANETLVDDDGKNYDDDDGGSSGGDGGGDGGDGNTTDPDGSDTPIGGGEYKPGVSTIANPTTAVIFIIIAAVIVFVVVFFARLRHRQQLEEKELQKLVADGVDDDDGGAASAASVGTSAGTDTEPDERKEMIYGALLGGETVEDIEENDTPDAAEEAAVTGDGDEAEIPRPDDPVRTDATTQRLSESDDIIDGDEDDGVDSDDPYGSDYDAVFDTPEEWATTEDDFGDEISTDIEASADDFDDDVEGGTSSEDDEDLLFEFDSDDIGVEDGDGFEIGADTIDLDPRLDPDEIEDIFRED